MAAFSTDLAPWIVVLIVIMAGRWAILRLYVPLWRIANSLDEIKGSLAKHN